MKSQVVLFTAEFISFIFKFLLVYGFAGLVMASIVHSLVRDRFSVYIQLLIGIGLAPFVISLLLYYELLFFWYASPLTYVLFIAFLLILLFLLFRKKLRALLQFIFFNPFFQSKTCIFALLIVFGAGMLLISYYIQNKPFIEHDMLEYAVQGKIFAEQKSILYQKHHYHENSGFYFVSLHGFSVPLLRTFEEFTNYIFNSEDLFFRSLNVIFGLLLLMLFFKIIASFTSVHYALVATAALFLNYGFIVIFKSFHIDTYRLFFFIASLYLMYHFLKEPSTSLGLLWGIILGAQSNIHSLGFILALMQIAVTFFFLKGRFRLRFTYSTFLFFALLTFGAAHYVFDILVGTGWLFNDIKFY